MKANPLSTVELFAIQHFKLASTQWHKRCMCAVRFMLTADALAERT